MTPQRYAIYVVPTPEEDWAAFCTAWLGWDLMRGQAVPHPPVPGVTDRISALTAVPRRYGLHATIKPPFRLAAGRSSGALVAAVQDLATTLSPITLDGLELTRLGRFLALCPTGPADALNALAARCVAELDRFRAPASEAELSKRRAAGLSPQQEDNLVRWGYPYVMDAFRFHITLTGRLPKDDLQTVQAALDRQLGPLLPRPFRIGSLALVGEDETGYFHAIRTFPLTG